MRTRRARCGSARPLNADVRRLDLSGVHMIDQVARETGSQWNAWSWFGPTLGSTLWLLLSAIFLLNRSGQLAGLVFVLFLLANLAGVWLWRVRARLSVFAAIQVFLATFWVCGIIAIYAIDRAGYWATLAVGGRNNISAWGAYVLLTILVAALVLIFRNQQRRSSGVSRGGV